MKKTLLRIILYLTGGVSLLAQPVNDPCGNALNIPLPGAGFGTGTVQSAVVKLQGATLQPGEYVPSGVPNSKTVWYKFSLPTTKRVKIILKQTGTTMNASDVGWTLYKNASCLPASPEQIDPPIFKMEGYTHECLSAGDYLIQVGASFSANDSVYFDIELQNPTIQGSSYDLAANAQYLGTISTPLNNPLAKDVSWEVGCQSIFATEEICGSNFTQSTWHIFKTDGSIDALRIALRETPWNSSNSIPRNWIINLYEGDARIDSVSLPKIIACDTLTQNSSSDFPFADLFCQLKPNTFYSLQILYPTGYTGSMNLRIFERGNGNTNGENPTSLPAVSLLGTLSPGIHWVSDTFSCEAYLSANLCGNAVPTDTLTVGSTQYDMGFWYVFTINTYANPVFYTYYPSCQPAVGYKLFAGDVSGNCNLSLLAEWEGSRSIPCLPPGTYSLLVLGRSNHNDMFTACGSSMSKSVNTRINITQPGLQKFGLHSPTEADSVNNGLPLNPGTVYWTERDTFDCRTTVMPQGDKCNVPGQPVHDRAIYRIIKVNTQGILVVGGACTDYYYGHRLRHKLYSGDARNLPVVGGEIVGLTPLTGCQNLCDEFKVCVSPGTYTLVTFGGEDDAALASRAWVKLDTFPVLFSSPSTAEQLPALSSSNPVVVATPARFTCIDNPDTILGLPPCNGATKLHYREIYLAEPGHVRFVSYYNDYYNGEGTVLWRIFRGRISTNSITSLLRDCHSWTYTTCLDTGWITVVSYGYDGNTWTNPAYNSGRGGVLGVEEYFRWEFLLSNVQNFGYRSPTEVGIINNLNPLDVGVLYCGPADTLDCRTTPTPDAPCGYPPRRASYYIVNLPSAGVLYLSGNLLSHEIYQGDVRNTTISNDTLYGMTRISCYQNSICIPAPGIYTLVLYGNVGDRTAPCFRFEELQQKFGLHTPAEVDSINGFNALSSGVTYFSVRDTLDCRNTPVPALANCGRNKAIYRIFKVDTTGVITISNLQYGFYYSLYAGNASANLNALTPVVSCTYPYYYNSRSFSACISQGEYTLVSYGRYEGENDSVVLHWDSEYQKYASLNSPGYVNGGAILNWGINRNTPAVPIYGRTYTFNKEHFDCFEETPFPSGITACNSANSQISFQVFTLQDTSFVHIYNLNGFASKLYEGDLSTLPPPYNLVHDCATDEMILCQIPPGTYTLVTFANPEDRGKDFQPSLFIDTTGVSKHNYAATAYDFGNIPGDGLWHNGNPSDSPGPNGEAPSNDFIFCSTDKAASDPPAGGCHVNSWPWNRQRNLWYTFTVTGSGTVSVNVKSLAGPTFGRYPLVFVIYKSDDVNFPAVIDSTTAQGLTYIAQSCKFCYSWCPTGCCVDTTVTFNRTACNSPTERYYIVVYRNGEDSSHYTQAEVNVKFTPSATYTAKYDHYSWANGINNVSPSQCAPPYISGILDEGTYEGCEDNLDCATKDPTDQNVCGTHTIWYVFETSVAGKIRINYDRPGNSQYLFDNNDIKLFRSVVNGDSTTSGLVNIPLTSKIILHDSLGLTPWGEGCIYPGKYYLMMTGCNHLGIVKPRIWLKKQRGDLCSDSLQITLLGPGTYSDSANVDCFTIGEAPSETDTSMGCLGSPVGKKSMWVYIDNNYPDTMDLDIQITENTTAFGGDIDYRIADGSCSGMTFSNCVDEGVFIILNLKCRPPFKGFWIQIVMPDWTTGEIKVNVTATPKTGSCVPIDPDKPVANFDNVLDCKTKCVQFINYSSGGTGVTYDWDFGDGFISSLQNPVHCYNDTVDTAVVTLVVDNGIKKDTARKQIVFYPVPDVSFSVSPPPPYLNIAGIPLTFNPVYGDTTSFTAYQWNFCASGTSSPCGASVSSYSGKFPPQITYSTPGLKTVCLTVSNGYCDSTYCMTLGGFFPGGYFDGSGITELFGTCPVTPFPDGGYYDGSAFVELLTTCVPRFSDGGYYDGSAFIELLTTCAPKTPDGGYYDGSGKVELINCPYPPDTLTDTLPNEYDGSALVELFATCMPRFSEGGYYDGSAFVELLTTCVPRFSDGGYYDGSAFIELLTTCAPKTPDGGYYDGSAFTELYGNLSILSVDTPCQGNSAVLVADNPNTNWFETAVGGTPLYTGNTFITPSLQHSMLYYAGLCGNRVPVPVSVRPDLQAQFVTSAVNVCVNENTYFNNQTVVSGPSQLDLGNRLISFGTHGTPPLPGRITFSSALYANFAMLYNNTHDGNQAWTPNTTSGGTVWAQWNYLSPRSVNRIVFWNNNAGTGIQAPLVGRLYYDQGNGWVLAKAFVFPYPSTGNYDSGIFFDTYTTFANRWKLELDVNEGQAPQWGEFKMYSSAPVIGGNVGWNFGDGSPMATGGNVAHIYADTGTYNVQMIVQAQGKACPDTLYKTLNVVDCSLLPNILNQLQGELKNTFAFLTWTTNEPARNIKLQKLRGNTWETLEEITRQGMTSYAWIDSATEFGISNYYRVLAEHHNGASSISNIIELIPENISRFSVVAFPNPVHASEKLFIRISLPYSSAIKYEVRDITGKLLQTEKTTKMQKGIYFIPVKTENLANGMYVLRVKTRKNTKVLKILHIR